MFFKLWSSPEETKPERVPLPLQALDRCSTCESQRKLRLCANCGERLYCSNRCQREDWPTHKKVCGETDRIELRSFYPFLGLIVEQFHNSVALEGHPALSRVLVGSPKLIRQADGTTCTVVSLGDSVSFDELVKNPEAWWPRYPSATDARRLRDRITREGNALLINTAICVALLAELYTTTSDTDAKRQDWQFHHRTRLTVGSCPVADFGIMAGSVSGPGIGRLAYYDTVTKSTTYGQDPKEHYWVYFVTIRGEVLYLDCGLYNLNPGNVLKADPYVADHLTERFTIIPAFLRDSVARKTMPNIHTERSRTSVLKNTEILEALMRNQREFEKENGKLYSRFMESISGKETSARDERLVTPFVQVTRAQIRANLLNARWKAYPPEPTSVPDIYDLIRPPPPTEVKQVNAVFAGWQDELKKIEDREARARRTGTKQH